LADVQAALLYDQETGIVRAVYSAQSGGHTSEILEITAIAFPDAADSNRWLGSFKALEGVTTLEAKPVTPPRLGLPGVTLGYVRSAAQFPTLSLNNVTDYQTVYSGQSEFFQVDLAGDSASLSQSAAILKAVVGAAP
jgi:hypothetical protein